MTQRLRCGESPVRMGQGNRSPDMCSDRFAGRVGDIVERQDDDVIAYAHAAAFAPIAPDRLFWV